MLYSKVPVKWGPNQTGSQKHPPELTRQGRDLIPGRDPVKGKGQLVPIAGFLQKTTITGPIAMADFADDGQLFVMSF